MYKCPKCGAIFDQPVHEYYEQGNLHVWSCPKCGAYAFWRTDWEYYKFEDLGNEVKGWLISRGEIFGCLP